MSQFFSTAINYRTDRERNFTVAGSVETAIRTIADNNYATFSNATDYAFITYGILPTQQTRISHIFVKSSGVTSYTMSIPSGEGTGTTMTRTLPSTVLNPQGKVVSITYDGMQNDLFELHIPRTVVNAQPLTSTITIANNLSTITQTSFDLEFSLANATLLSSDLSLIHI